ncbi:MAG: hypothetical protein HQK96_14095 [Nitrospirae bacterium]|nr:hypothetical protein [Nitrospirota bacterium]
MNRRILNVKDIETTCIEKDSSFYIVTLRTMQISEEETIKLKKSVRKRYKDVLKETQISNVEKLVEKYGNDAVFKNGFKHPRIKKLIIKYNTFDILGDIYDNIPTFSYKDAKYNYKRFRKQELQERWKGYMLYDLAEAAAGLHILPCLEIALEETAVILSKGDRSGRYTHYMSGSCICIRRYEIATPINRVIS